VASFLLFLDPLLLRKAGGVGKETFEASNSLEIYGEVEML
jgi:hypothetical protein